MSALRQTLAQSVSLLLGDREADRVVPPTGYTARLTVFTAGAMAFLAVFALALALATGRLATVWAEDLAQTSTLRISAPEAQLTAQTSAALEVLRTTPGIADARALGPDETRGLLEPWLGPDVPVETLPIPQLIEITHEGAGYDATGLRARLQAEVPGAVLDDHARWREPLVRSATRLRTLGLVALALIGASMAALITLAAQSSLAANARVIRVLRMVGALDTTIARAFVRRFTLRALVGAAIGTALAMIAVAALPRADEAESFLTGLGFQGTGWLWPLLVPPFAAMVAFFATRAAAFRTLRSQS